MPGVGEKTAAKLVNKYKDLDGVFAHLDEMTPSLKKNLAASEEMVRRNLTVIPLVRDAPLAEQPHDLKMGGWSSPEVAAIFEKLELKTAWGRLEPMLSSGELTGEWVEQPVASPAKVPSVDLGAVEMSRPQADDLVEALRRLGQAQGPVAVVPYWSGDPGRSSLEGIVLATDGDPAESNEAARNVVWVDGPAMSQRAGRRGVGEAPRIRRPWRRRVPGEGARAVAARSRHGHDGVETRRRGGRLPARPVERPIRSRAGRRHLPGRGRRQRTGSGHRTARARHRPRESSMKRART